MSILDMFLTAGTIVLGVIIAIFALFVLWVVGSLLFYGFATVACASKRRSRRKKLQKRREVRYGKD